MTALRELSFLIVDSDPDTRDLLRDMMNGVGLTQVQEAFSTDHALTGLQREVPDAVLVAMRNEPMDALDFTRAVRRGEAGQAAAPVPILFTASSVDRDQVEQARDAGVTEFLVWPFSAKQLLARLETLIKNPRPFVETEDFAGPDRRRHAGGGFSGPDRRGED